MQEFHACSSVTPDLTAYLTEWLCTRKTAVKDSQALGSAPKSGPGRQCCTGCQVPIWSGDRTALADFLLLQAVHAFTLDISQVSIYSLMRSLKIIRAEVSSYLRNWSDLTGCRAGTQHPTQEQTWTQTSYLETFLSAFSPSQDVYWHPPWNWRTNHFYEVVLAHASLNFFRHWAEEKGWRKHWA